jgi:hypothetical protein
MTFNDCCNILYVYNVTTVDVSIFRFIVVLMRDLDRVGHLDPIAGAIVASRFMMGRTIARIACPAFAC